MLNRPCRNCTPPCQGGEVLHRRGYCCHSYCLCVAFDPEKATLAGGALGTGTVHLSTEAARNRRKGYVR